MTTTQLVPTATVLDAFADCLWELQVQHESATYEGDDRTASAINAQMEALCALVDEWMPNGWRIGLTDRDTGYPRPYIYPKGA